MCGINGFNWGDRETITKMNQALKNRGPDGEGTYINDAVSLGHRRLSIIDLSEKGSQPMCNEDGSIWLAYNGEIYNFKDLRTKLKEKGHIFKSETDSEVIIHAYEEYGCDCVSQFNGMWAFSIYDKNKGLLVLSRDRFGIKPLYYYSDDNRFIFSSMISGILCHDIPRSPNNSVIMEYLAYNLGHQNEQTFFNDIYSLKPGTLMIYDLKTRQYQKRQWYHLEPQKTPDEHVIKDIFTDSVKSMTVADVSIGSCLSGGVDSSAIVVLLDKFLEYKFNTFSFVVPGTPLDESKYIIEVGKNTKTNQYFTEIDPQEFLQDIEDFIFAQEEPVTSISPYAQYRVMKLAHDQGAKVLLDGQGGDELFGGYIYYFSYYFYELLTRLNWFTLVKEMMLYRQNFKNSYPIKMFAFLLMPDWVKHSAWKRLSNGWMNDEMLEAAGEGEDPRWKAMSLKEGLLLTLFSTSIPLLLRFEDKNSMRWSIESRVPFLDVRLVEQAMSLTSSQKLNNGRTKVTYRKAVEGLVPKCIIDRKGKMGFVPPSDRLLRDEKVIDLFQDIIHSDSFKQRPYWKLDKVEDLFQAHISGKKNYGDTIWKLINTELWLRYYFPDRV